MDLIQLRMFCAVAESGSLVRAAEQLHRVPSNLTTRLRQLEQELQGDLFIREKQRLRLSPLGYNFLDYARRILVLSDEALALAQGAKPSGSLTLGTMESIAATKLPALLAAYHRRYPDVSLSLVTGTSGELLDGVRQGRLAAALTDTPAAEPALNISLAFRDQLLLITGDDVTSVKTPQDLANATLFAFRASCSYRQTLEQWFYQHGMSPKHIMEIQSYHTMIACVAGGAAMAVVPASLLAQISERDRVRIHSLPNTLQPISGSLIWRKQSFSTNLAALWQLMPEVYPESVQCPLRDSALISSI